MQTPPPNPLRTRYSVLSTQYSALSSPSLRASVPSCLRAFRKGFSFIEILFALFVLGIGLVMVAAVFPVAIQQTQAAVDQTTGIAVVEEGRRYMDQFIREEFHWPFSGSRTNRFANASGNVTTGMRAPCVTPGTKPSTGTYQYDLTYTMDRVSHIDPRFAWVPLIYFPQVDDATNPINNKYTHATKFHTAWVYIIPVQYGSSVVTTADLENLTCVQTNVRLTRTVDGSFVEFTNWNNRPAQGAFIIIADNPSTSALLRGTYYRLAFLTDPGTNRTWRLSPEKELPIAIGSPVSASAFIVGRNGAARLDVDVPSIGPFPVNITRK